jgi:DNA-binding transcriptional LysR family regulator
MSHARADARHLDQTPRGKLRIGCTTAAAQFILPTVFREFKESFPLYEIKVVCGETPDTIERLVKNQVDITVSLRPQEVSRQTQLPRDL